MLAYLSTYRYNCAFLLNIVLVIKLSSMMFFFCRVVSVYCLFCAFED